MTCSICLENIKDDIKNPLVKFCCKQPYHLSCIKTWTDNKLTCPICRKLLTCKTLNILKNIQNNVKELIIKEERAHHIIETLMLDICQIKERTKSNLKKLSNVSSYTQPPVIPHSPPINRSNPLNFSRLLRRRGAFVLPLITNDDCRSPAFCRCMHCLPGPSYSPRWN